MSEQVTSILGRRNWLQHHLPWLAALSLIMGLLRDEPASAGDLEDWAA
jgi:hypothetical protein